MVLEATVIIVDNSEPSRNGDYLYVLSPSLPPPGQHPKTQTSAFDTPTDTCSSSPSRFEAQSDAVNLIFSAKTQSNPESSVGLMTMGGAQPEVLTTLTNDFGKILEGLHRTKIRGSAHLSTALNVAQLALKHRQNKSQHQRIIVFTCSPLAEDEKTVVKLAKRLKKNNIHVDVIAFGDLDDGNLKKVEAFHENIKGTASGPEGSNLAVIRPSANLLSDSIVATSILAGDGMGGGGGAGGGDGSGGGVGGDGSGFEFGVDPNTDPELALALRMSMEEEERRQREQREQQEKESKPPLESVPEGEEGGSSSGAGAAGESSGDKPDEPDKKDGEDKMDTA